MMIDGDSAYPSMNSSPQLDPLRLRTNPSRRLLGQLNYFGRQKNDEQMAHSLGILSDCLMGRYTLSKRIDDLEEADIAIRNIFRSKWRKDIKKRVFDMVRFGAVCLKRYVVAESQPSDGLITFMEM